MKNRKLIISLASAGMVAVLAIGGTLAYFTDAAGKSNIVTMGRVEIALTETSTDENATITEDGITFTHIMPGDNINKEPVITLKKGSADSYIRVKLAVITGEDSTITSKELAEIEHGLNLSTDWMKGTGRYYYYQKSVTAKENDAAVPVFTTVKIPGSFGNNTALGSFEIQIKAEAIQADNFNADADKNGMIDSWMDGNTAIIVETYDK